MRRRNGYLVMEVVIGLTLVGLLMVALTVAVVRQNQAAGALAERRAAVAEAEAALVRLQSGQLPVPAEGVQLTVRRLEEPARSRGVWVEMTARRGNRSVALIGLAPEQAMQRWQAASKAQPAASSPAGTQPAESNP